MPAHRVRLDPLVSQAWTEWRVNQVFQGSPDLLELHHHQKDLQHPSDAESARLVPSDLQDHQDHLEML